MELYKNFNWTIKSISLNIMTIQLSFEKAKEISMF